MAPVSKHEANNIFAMQQAKDREACRLATANAALPTINPTQEAENTPSMRFSFALPENNTFKRDRFRRAISNKKSSLPKKSSPLARAPDLVLNQNFQQLSFNENEENFDGDTVAAPESFYQTWLHQPINTGKSAPLAYPSLSPPKQAVPAKQSIIPTKKQRTGFGLSYTDSMIYASDHDTETESDDETVLAPETSSLKPQTLPTNATFSFTSCSSFSALVLRAPGSFYTARPQRRLPCTSATREDTLRIKAAATALLKFEESMDIYGALVVRLERMIKQDKAASATDCARKLRDFLRGSEEVRVLMGEVRAVVRHEGEWGEWMVDAVGTGVMHVKGVGFRRQRRVCDDMSSLLRTNMTTCLLRSCIRVSRLRLALRSTTKFHVESTGSSRTLHSLSSGVTYVMAGIAQAAMITSFGDHGGNFEVTNGKFPPLTAALSYTPRCDSVWSQVSPDGPRSREITRVSVYNNQYSDRATSVYDGYYYPGVCPDGYYMVTITE
ncbi:hypothetical protein CC86DRAFT_384229 [Ophiobolus disseminans]|uniref:Uncharacterized protein n=1 Tax=Ophiobolus disseminans TaxID=1469910 RepID=A0A6A6ZTK6_9PLEO|nr:hypothetical protein CC86DRAFT_384229 [Ophiobolus disseminans]